MARLFRILLAPAFAALLVASANVAQADYSYSSTSFSTTAPMLTVTALSGTQPDSIPANPVLFSFAIAGTPVGTYAFNFTESLSSATLGSQTFTVAGTLQVFFSSANAVISTFVANTLTASNGNYVEYAGSANYITSVSGTSATLAIGIVPAINFAVVPEPASIAMLGLGLVGSIGVTARRRLARA